jgi:hypothetical protein
LSTARPIILSRAARHQRVGFAIANQNVAGERGYASLTEFRQDVLRITRSEANRRIQHAYPLPAIAAALRTGELGPEHAGGRLAGLPHKVLPGQSRALHQSGGSAPSGSNAAPLDLDQGRHPEDDQWLGLKA